MCHVHTEIEEIVCTPNHSILTADGWKFAGELTTNDMVKTSTGFVKVKFVKTEELDEKINVYNLNVLGYHTYIIGKVLFVVHNECHHTVSNKGSRGQEITKKITDKIGDIDVNADWNLVDIPSHRGRHTNAYHDMVEKVVDDIFNQGVTSPEEFKYKMSFFKKLVKELPDCLTKNGAGTCDKILQLLGII